MIKTEETENAKRQIWVLSREINCFHVLPITGPVGHTLLTIFGQTYFWIGSLFYADQLLLFTYCICNPYESYYDFKV